MMLTLLLLAVAFFDTSAPPEGYELSRVQVIFRHGARSTISTFPIDDGTWNCELQSVSSYYLSGDNEETHWNPSFRLVYDTGDNVLTGTCPLGYLTPNGMEQEIQNGRDFISDYRAFAGTSLSSEDIYLRSTDVERTKLSLQGFVDGMDLLDNQETRVIHVASSGADVFVHPKCNLHDAEKSFLKKPEAKKFLAQFDQRLKEINTLIGAIKVTQISWKHIYGNLVARKNLSIPFPPGVTDEDFALSHKITDYVHGLGMCNTNHTERVKYLSVYTGRALAFLFESLFGKEPLDPSHATKEKIMLFSAHDTTVAPLIAVYGGMDEKYCGAPNYASTIRIELYAPVDCDRESLIHYGLVRFQYNREVVRPPFCATEYCTVPEYFAGIKEYIPIDFYKACSEPW